VAESQAGPTPEASLQTAESGPEAGTDRPRRSRSRGSRGGARRSRSQAAATPRAESLPNDTSAVQPVTPPRRESGPNGASVPRPGRPAPSGNVESLIARQNVLFEEFAQQQAQTLREVQRAVRGIGGAQGAAGNMMALPKVAVFVDVPNLIYTSEQMGVRVHFGKLLDYLTEGRQLVRATAYAPITDDPQTRFEQQRFIAPVINHGYKIITKPWKRFADGSMKANFDIELAVDILTMSDRLDVVVLLSGDGDFRRVCELVESKGVRVEVVAFAASTAMELRSVADQYTDLGSILNVVGI
jgi:uncharacterized LabA/DUF88 family protein